MPDKWRKVKENLNELSATIETIKLWKFLSEDGDRSKVEYFNVPTSQLDGIIRAGCFYCEYYQIKNIMNTVKNIQNRMRH